jgi:hypothetical protein
MGIELFLYELPLQDKGYQTEIKKHPNGRGIKPLKIDKKPNRRRRWP